MWSYKEIEEGMRLALAGAGSPFRTVEGGAGHLSDVELLARAAALANAQTAPAALIGYGGGRDSESLGGMVEVALFQVLAIGIDRTPAEAGRQVHDVLAWVREKLHDVTGISGINNPLRWKRNDKFRVGDEPATVAAWVVTFEAEVMFRTSQEPVAFAG